MTSLAIASDDPSLNILVLADEMETYGWKIERQQLPDCLHFSIFPYHFDHKVGDKLLKDLGK